MLLDARNLRTHDSIGAAWPPWCSDTRLRPPHPSLTADEGGHRLPPAPMRVLGIETSCDETAAAVIEDGSVILSNVVVSQAQTHARYGGIVPELASRQHMVTIVPAVRQALDESGLELGSVDAIAVTHGPGLAGSLLIGVGAAKGLALAADLPLLGVQPPRGPRLRRLARGRRSGARDRLPAPVPHNVGRPYRPGRYGGPRALRAARAHQGRRRPERRSTRRPASSGSDSRAALLSRPSPSTATAPPSGSRAPTSSARSTSPSAASRPP